jgi:AraC-like DNA-binding protein
MQSFFEKREYSRERPVKASFGENLDFLAHWHQDFELLFVLEGVQGVSVNNTFQVLKAGELAFCRSGDVHFYDDTHGNGRFVLAFADAGFLREQAEWTDRVCLARPFLSMPEAEPAFRTLAEEDSNRESHYTVAMKAAMLDIVSRVLRSPFLKVESPSVSPALDPTKAKVQEALRLLEADFAEDLSHDSLAERLSISPSYFSRIFNRATGMGFREYLNHLRVERAEQMLAEPDRTVTDIAFACGFGSLRTFHRAFREVTGRTPLEERKHL